MSEFRPRYEITSAIRARTEEVDRAHWLIDNVLLMPKHETWFRREVAVKRAVATTRIEGADLGEEAVERLVDTTLNIRLSDDERANVGALDAYHFIDELSDLPDQPLNEFVIREINRRALYGVGEILTPGVYRNGQNRVGDRFMPPDQGDVPELMHGLGQWLASTDHDEHPVVVAALAHLQFVAIHPFWDGNGRTARGLATLVLQRSGLAFKKLLAVEATLWSRRDEYFTAIERSLGRAYSDDYDATHFVEVFAHAVAAAASDLQARMTDWHRQVDALQRSLSAAGVRQRQVEAMQLAAKTGRITRADYMQMTGLSHQTASSDLADLVAKGFLRPEGETRRRTYIWLPPEALSSTGSG